METRSRGASARSYLLLTVSGWVLTVTGLLAMLPAIYLFSQSLQALFAVSNNNLLTSMVFGAQGLFWLPLAMVLGVSGQGGVARADMASGAE